MSKDRLQHSLNDYLDDLLDADERKRFEERLAGDEELAQQLALARDIRRELRSGEDELSAAFYTRTVARFSAQRRRLPFGLSWSTAGLALATIAVAAVFVPSVLREEIPDLPSAPQAREEGLAKESTPESIGHVADELAAADPRKDDAVVSESFAESKPGFPDIVGDRAPEDRERQAANKPAPAPPAIAQQPKRKVATVPIPEPLSKLQAEPAEIELEEQALGRGRASGAVAADGLELDNESDFDAVPLAVELDLDLVGAGEVELFDARDARLQPSAERKKETRVTANFASPAPSVAANRFVAIGRHPGLDACAALAVRRTDKAWEINYENSGSSVGSVSCGIEIPDDGLEIRFQGWPVGE